MKPSLIDYAIVKLLVFLLEHSSKEHTHSFVNLIEIALNRGEITKPKHLLRIRMILPKIAHLL